MRLATLGSEMDLGYGGIRSRDKFGIGNNCIGDKLKLHRKNNVPLIQKVIYIFIMFIDNSYIISNYKAAIHMVYLLI